MAERWACIFFALSLIFCFKICLSTYKIDDRLGYGRRFDGIGAISGGGATSKLLVNYKEPHRTEILDYLFKPNFGASLQILKVEIGGDSQSTDGTESSHMHFENDENYNRGYEWWLMKEAKKRNPEIKLYGLPWVWPGWLGGGKFNPYSNITRTATYITNWIGGAKKVHNLTIDFIGIWNERPYNADYIKLLRRTLDSKGLRHVRIVAADGEWSIVGDLLHDPDLFDAIDVVGVHYPDAHSPDNALILDRPLWASEEYSANNDVFGGGCWARVLNEGYVNGLLSATIAWNLVTSYYDNLPYPKSSLMTANQPWSGSYNVATPVWISAHFTQFSRVGWKYLPHGLGVGNFTHQGSYTSMTDGKDLSVFIVTMDPKLAHCFYPMPKYTVSQQNVTFELGGSFKNLTKLHLWYTKLDFKVPDKSVIFQKRADVKVTKGLFSLNLGINEVYTLTTLSSGKKGSHPKPPPESNFPVPYSENFDNYTDSAEAFNFAQQAGSFEVRTLKGKNKGLVQVVPVPPIDTCLPQRMTKPVTLIGDYKWADTDVSVDFMLTEGGTPGVFLAARVVKGGCETMYSNGIFLWVLPHKKGRNAYSLVVTGNFSRSVIYAAEATTIDKLKWYKLGLVLKGNHVTATLSGKIMIQLPMKKMPSKNGFLALGTETFAEAVFDNFKIKSAKSTLTFNKPEYRDSHLLSSMATS